VGLRLFHYTCHHGVAGIGRWGHVRPLRQHSPDAAARIPEGYEWMTELAWFTDLSRPDPIALGLTRRITRCDRTAFRYTVLEPDLCTPWLDVLPDMPKVARKLAMDEGLPGRWWIATEPVPVVL
jgi:hypothetical protein